MSLSIPFHLKPLSSSVPIPLQFKIAQLSPHAVFTPYTLAIPQPIVSSGFHPTEAIQPKISIWPNSNVNFSLFLKLNMHINHLGIFKKCIFRFSRSEVKPKIQPCQCEYRLSVDQFLSNKCVRLCVFVILFIVCLLYCLSVQGEVFGTMSSLFTTLARHKVRI